MRKPVVSLSGASQRGVALIMALMVFALVTAVATSVMSLLVRERQVVEQVQTTVALKEQLMGGEAWAMAQLTSKDQAQWPTVNDSRWVLESKTFPLENEEDSMTVVLVDRQSCYNLNRLAGEDGDQAQQQLARLFGQLGGAGELVDQIRDWVDEDQDLTGRNGHEDEFYLALSPPYRTADHLLVAESEFSLWQADSDELDKVFPWLCIWPEDLGLNLSRIPETMLDVMVPDLNEEQSSSVKARLSSGGYANVDEFMEDPNLLQHELKKEDWRTDIALVDAFVSVTIGERTMALHSKLYKSPDGPVVSYYRSFGPNAWLLKYYDPSLGQASATDEKVEN